MIKGLWSKYKLLPVQLKATIWFLVCSFLQKGIQFITTPIFTRIMSPTEFGQYSVFLSWQGIIIVFVTLCLYNGVFVQGLVKFDNKEQFISSMQGLTLVLFLVWGVIYYCRRAFWNNLFGLSSLQMLSMFLLMLSTAFFGFWSVEQRVNYKYKELVIVTLVVSILNSVVGILAVVFCRNKVVSRIVSMALIEIIIYMPLAISQIKRGKRLFDKGVWLYALKYNIPLIPHYLSMTVLNSSDRIMINNMVGASEAGIYSLAYSVSQVMGVFNTAMIQTLEPWLYQKIKCKQLKEISPIAYSCLVIVGIVNIVLIMFAPEAVKVFAPERYYEAIYVIPPVAMSIFFSFIYFFFAVFEFYYESTKYVMIATTIGATTNVLLNACFIPKYGYIAAAYTTLICYVMFSFFHYYFMRLICNKELQGAKIYDLRKILVIIGIFVFAGFWLLFTYNNLYLRYFTIFFSLAIMLMKRNNIIANIKKVIILKKGNDYGEHD